jgi:hypothetical protein
VGATRRIGALIAFAKDDLPACQTILNGIGNLLADYLMSALNPWPHPRLANNLFASSCDNLRPIIAFGTRHLRSSSWPSVNSPSSNPSEI